MKLQEDAKLLRIFIGESDKYKQRPLYEAIVYAAKKKGLAGATVMKGILSFGAKSKIHSLKVFALSNDLPIVIEIVDEAQNIEEFNDIVDKMFKKANCGGMITIEKIKVLTYRSGN